MAAVAAKREGKSVIIVEPARTLGGMVGGGIRVNRDTRHPGDIGGLTRMMMEKDIAIGGGRHENQPQFREAFDELVAKHGITVLYHHRLGTIAKTGTKIERLLLDYAPVEADGCPAAKAQQTGAFQIEAAVFIDASYEGDLMALAGVPYAVGREGRGEFNESLAGQRNLKTFDLSPYVTPGDPTSGLLPMIDPEPYVEGGASRHIMAYNFRFVWVPAGQGVKVGTPTHFDAARYELVLRALRRKPDYVGWPNHTVPFYSQKVDEWSAVVGYAVKKFKNGMRLDLSMNVTNLLNRKEMTLAAYYPEGRTVLFTTGLRF
jgi:hypothetical protein